MRICVTLLPRSRDEAVALLRRARRSELAELRIDAIPDADPAALLKGRRPPVIVTNRRREEGGSFDGTPADALALAQSALRSGAEYVDAELARGKAFFGALGAPARRIICSFHDTAGTPSDLAAIYERAKRMPAAVIKIAVTAATLADNLAMFALMQRAARERRRFVGICMGERGEISRILGGKFGAFLTFASPDGASPAAPGQLTLSMMKNIFHAGSVGRRTRVFGLLGNPVRHSRGYLFHNGRFHRRGCDAVYVNFLADDCTAFFRDYRELISGVSVTMPFKSDVIAHLDAVDADAASLCAVNTVVRRRGGLSGSNTDLPAVAGAIRRAGSFRGKEAAVLGTGGMAATMAWAALRSGARTTIYGRTQPSARALAARLGCAWRPLDALPAGGIDLLMNATPVGMLDASASPAPNVKFHRRMTVVDAVNNPEGTRLLVEARGAGCATVDGLAIFRAQARRQSRLFMEAM